MEKKGRQIFSTIVRASKLTRQRTLRIYSAHHDRSCCWQHWMKRQKKTFSFTVSWQKQIKLYFSTRNWVVIKFSAFSFKPLMLKLTKIDKKTIICHVWRYCKDLTFAHPLFTASCSRMSSPVNQTNRFLMVSFLILLRSLRIIILKQLFTTGSVNIVE